MVFQRTEGGDAEVEACVLHASAQTEVYLWQTAAEHDAVVSIDDTILVDILIEAVADDGTGLCGVVVEVGLCAGDALIDPTIELTNLLAYEGSIVAGNV